MLPWHWLFLNTECKISGNKTLCSSTCEYLTVFWNKTPQKCFLIFMDVVFRCHCKTGQDFLTFGTKNRNTFLAANNASSNMQMMYFKNLLVHLNYHSMLLNWEYYCFDDCMSLKHNFPPKIVQLHQELFGFQFFSTSNQTIRGSLKEHSAVKLFTSTSTS